jgi:hypothetical protein
MRMILWFRTKHYIQKLQRAKQKQHSIENGCVVGGNEP